MWAYVDCGGAKTTDYIVFLKILKQFFKEFWWFMDDVLNDKVLNNFGYSCKSRIFLQFQGHVEHKMVKIFKFSTIDLKIELKDYDTNWLWSDWLWELIDYGKCKHIKKQ